MINIIKEGRVPQPNTLECVCQTCGCVFRFNYPEDTKSIPTDYNDYQRVVECPCCKKLLKIWPGN